MQGISDVGTIRVSTVKYDGHFRSVEKRRVEAVSITGIRFRQPQPQIRIALFGTVAVKVQFHTIAALRVEPGVRITFLCAFHPGRQRAGYHRATEQRRTVTDGFAVGDPLKRQRKATFA